MPELCTIDPITCRSSNAIYERHDWYGDNGQISWKPDIQHHPLNLTGNRDNDIKDISKRLEVIEKLLKYKRWYPHNRNREYSPNQNQTQNRDQNPNRNQNRNQNQNQDNQNKQEDNQPKAKEKGSQSKTEHTDKKDLNK